MTSRPRPAPAAQERAGIVRLYTVTDGRTQPRHTLTLHTVLAAGPRTPRDLPEESRHILALCRERSRPLVELAGTLSLHVTAVRVLVSDLIDAGALSLPIPDGPGEDRDVAVLLRLSAALKSRFPHVGAKAG
ncbi:MULTISPECIES: DUF742 domain-containing protein [unclassified Streptomyces]|uniref:DUF742 domain-containing protein n=1 Tax=unclassified Streptomyces TaxID=2593676 RepID=UPI0036E681C3